MSRPIATLDKDSIMPIGKHKGKKMKDVPDDYYVWLYNKYKEEGFTFRLGKMGSVIAYIIRNLDSIQAHYSINTKHNFDKKAFIKKYNHRRK